VAVAIAENATQMRRVGVMVYLIGSKVAGIA
jgi:hypothetical protein